MKISRLEANFLLFAMDEYIGVDANGHIMSAKHGYKRADLQSLRDKLFAAHEHAEEIDPTSFACVDDRVDGTPSSLRLKT